ASSGDEQKRKNQRTSASGSWSCQLDITSGSSSRSSKPARSKRSWTREQSAPQQQTYTHPACSSCRARAATSASGTAVASQASRQAKYGQGQGNTAGTSSARAASTRYSSRS